MDKKRIIRRFIDYVVVTIKHDSTVEIGRWCGHKAYSFVIDIEYSKALTTCGLDKQIEKVLLKHLGIKSEAAIYAYTQGYSCPKYELAIRIDVPSCRDTYF